MSIKTRGSEKIPLFLVSLWAIINTKERNLRASLCIAIVEVT